MTPAPLDHRPSLDDHLRAVDWAALRTAYGNASALPPLLERVAHAPQAEAIDALEHILAHVCHQDHLEESAVAVMAPLQTLVDEAAHCPRWQILAALTRILGCGEPTHTVLGEVPVRRGFAGATPADPAAAAAYRTRSDGVQAAFDTGSATYLRHLRATLPEERAHAARAAALVAPPATAGIADALLEAARREEDEAVRAAMVFGLGVATHQAGPGSSGSRFDPPLFSRDAAGPVRFAWLAARVLAGLPRVPADGEPRGTGAQRTAAAPSMMPPAADAAPLAAAFGIRRLPLVRFPWCRGSLAGCVAEALQLLGEQSEREAVLDLLEQGFLDAIRAEQPDDEYWEWTEPQIVGERTTLLGFREFRGRNHDLLPEELDPRQRSLLLTLDGAGIEIPALPYCAFRLAGWATRFLEADGPLDRRVSLAWHGRTHTWPVWKWLRLYADTRYVVPEASRLQRREALLAAIGRLGGTEEIAEDGLAGTYDLVRDGEIRELLRSLPSMA